MALKIFFIFGCSFPWIEASALPLGDMGAAGNVPRRGSGDEGPSTRREAFLFCGVFYISLSTDLRGIRPRCEAMQRHGIDGGMLPWVCELCIIKPCMNC